MGIEISDEKLRETITRNSFENIEPHLKGKGKSLRFATPGKWRENFTNSEKDLIEKIIGYTLKVLGYQ